MGIESFSKLLQMSLVPVAFISGVGLLLLSITNRLGRSIDRARHLTDDLEREPASAHAPIKAQLHILLRRSRFLRTSAICVAGSIFFSCLMVIGLFFLVFLGWPVQNLILIFFFFAIVALTLAAIFLILDISLALKALRLELQPHLD